MHRDILYLRPSVARAPPRPFTALRYLSETLVNTKPVNDYRSPAATNTVSRVATQCALVVTLLILVSFIVFCLLRRRQLSLPDPYNNPYSNWSTACLCAFLALTVADFVVLVSMRQRVARSVRRVGSVVVAAAGLYIVFIFIYLVQFF
jgi:hypothetical protein